MKDDSGILTTNLIDLFEGGIYFAELAWREGIISDIRRLGPERLGRPYLLPGFVDAHVHIESSMLTPVEFSRLAVRHGTVATVSDPHEIANVLGLQGIHFMFANAEQTPLKIRFGAPSCVPATPFETAGAELGVAQLEALFASGEVGYLSEMMNYPGVLAGDPAVLEKLAVAQRHGAPIDGHAPGLVGKDAQQYAAAGISTDHECASLDEALDKISAGMHILIREGSAARNFEALHELIRLHPDKVMFCSDDKHPDDLQRGHINQLAARAVAKGHDVFAVLRCACLNPVRHYRLPVGQLHVGNAMDAVLVDDLTDFQALQTWIDGRTVASRGICRIESFATESINRFSARPVEPADFAIPDPAVTIRAIKAFDGELATEEWLTFAKCDNGMIVADTERDILFLAVVNRYQAAPPAVALIHGFGFKHGALASTVAHDSHNIIAVGATIEALCLAVNDVIRREGGIVVVNGKGRKFGLTLPVAGLMTGDDAEFVAAHYAELDRQAKRLGSTLRAPFMTLSFMALLVIPALKLSDKGLFDGRRFEFTSLAVT
ncbi:adenine deaminase [Methylomarinum vadi]|uniref:adenine deaminase n=1 Tax=Methylomarinum vadi TaxID=438855 RepID=UPI000A6AB85B|nr:adenine deaminase [Methylomarinum vadi]